MTPLPKKKHSKSASRTRVSAISLKVTQLQSCPSCKSPKKPHVACPTCGYVKEGLQINMTSR